MVIQLEEKNTEHVNRLLHTGPGETVIDSLFVQINIPSSSDSPTVSR